MSTENPPSIAPQRPSKSSSGPAGKPTDSPSGDPKSPTTGGEAAGSPVAEAPAGPAFADRLKKVTGSSKASSATSIGSGSARPEGGAESGPRRVRLAVARIDPWSAMKLSFLLSVAIGIMIVVASAVVWQTLNGLAVFTKINDFVVTMGGDASWDILDYVAFDRVISLATMIGVVDVVLLTALSTIMAFLYNIVAALVGGLHLTLTDD